MFLLIIRRPPRSALFPYTPLFRSNCSVAPRNARGKLYFPTRHRCLPLACAEDATSRHVGGASHRQVDRKSTRLNFSHANISYAVFCLKKNLHPSSLCPTPVHAPSC